MSTPILLLFLNIIIYNITTFGYIKTNEGKYLEKRKPKLIIEACILNFNGTPYEQIAEELKINKGTITNWRKTDIWKQTETKLIEAYIEKSVNTQEIKIMRDTHA